MSELAELSQDHWTWVTRGAVSLGFGPLNGGAPTWVVVGVASGQSVLVAWDNRPPRVRPTDLVYWLIEQGLAYEDAAWLAESLRKAVQAS